MYATEVAPRRRARGPLPRRWKDNITVDASTVRLAFANRGFPTGALAAPRLKGSVRDDCASGGFTGSRPFTYLPAWQMAGAVLGPDATLDERAALADEILERSGQAALHKTETERELLKAHVKRLANDAAQRVGAA